MLALWLAAGVVTLLIHTVPEGMAARSVNPQVHRIGAAYARARVPEAPQLARVRVLVQIPAALLLLPMPQRYR